MILYWINNKPHVAVANGFKEISMLEANDLNQRNEIKRNEVVR